jgi:hypothetical protein
MGPKVFTSCRQPEWFVRADMAVGEPVSQGRTALRRGEAGERGRAASKSPH